MEKSRKRGDNIQIERYLKVKTAKGKHRYHYANIKYIEINIERAIDRVF